MARNVWGSVRSVAAFSLAPAVGIATAPILARALGPDGRGQLAGILQPLTLADQVAAFGVPVAAAYFIANGSDARAVRRLSLVSCAALSFLTFAILAAYAGPVSRAIGVDRVLVTGIWLSVIPGALIAARRGAWSGYRRWPLLDAERSLSAISRLFAIVALWLAGAASVSAFAAGPIVLGLTGSAFLLLRTFPATDRTAAPELRTSAFARYSVAAASGSILMASAARLDQAVLPSLVSPTDLGHYSVAVTVAEVPLVIGIVLNRNLLSEVASTKRIQPAVRATMLGVLCTAIIAVTIAVTAPVLIPIVFGSAFDESVRLVQVLSAASVVQVGVSGTCAILNGLGKPWIALLPYLGAVAVTVGYFVLSPAVTVLGVAIVATMTSCVALLVAGVLLFEANRTSEGEFVS